MSQRVTGLNWGRLQANVKPGTSEFWRQALIGDVYQQTSGEQLPQSIQSVMSRLPSNRVVEAFYASPDSSLPSEIGRRNSDEDPSPRFLGMAPFRTPSFAEAFVPSILPWWWPAADIDLNQLVAIPFGGVAINAPALPAPKDPPINQCELCHTVDGAYIGAPPWCQNFGCHPGDCYYNEKVNKCECGGSSGPNPPQPFRFTEACAGLGEGVIVVVGRTPISASEMKIADSDACAAAENDCRYEASTRCPSGYGCDLRPTACKRRKRERKDGEGNSEEPMEDGEALNTLLSRDEEYGHAYEDYEAKLVDYFDKSGRNPRLVPRGTDYQSYHGTMMRENWNNVAMAVAEAEVIWRDNKKVYVYISEAVVLCDGKCGAK